MTQTERLKRLAKLAEIRSDAELKRFSAFRTHMDMLVARKAAAEARLSASFAQPKAFSIAEARLANAEAGRLAREMAALDAEMARMRPGFEAARQKAVQEFGRVQALTKLAEAARNPAQRHG
ncbi:hypothetical protein [Paracoccus sediminicola]|uniref:hypothetical protein n=1 Tax=Paracoccus sediminicola TaxID=3017783 RepID=UPI0022F130B7|nr:hypothetical protein [Paracoccus sediminicola]WBU56734.1 hypothetical protein PAF18_14870 [Paracoccus sediminicola]